MTPPKPQHGDWVLVPREPTEAMVERGRDQLSQGDAKVQTHARVLWVWEAMLNSAPPPAVIESERADAWVDAMLIDMAELPDRTSPDDYPDMLMIIPDEMQAMLIKHMPPARSARTTAGAREAAASTTRHTKPRSHPSCKSTSRHTAQCPACRSPMWWRCCGRRGLGY